MADSTFDITAQVSEGIPAWLDFTTLRSASIAYLGNVTGDIWTDYNVHDPGITTLEALIYGVLDLGYRTHLPLNDLLARDPSQTGTDRDFFTAGELLGCNPLTILDYRKLLLDIDGVRNAWVMVDPNPPLGIHGFYEVCIQLEKELDDFVTAADFDAYQQTVLCRIRRVLMAHRNLCEDFYSVYFLCDMNVGVCADIELATGTDPGTCYQALITALAAFFSPVPTYYTLQQMLARQVPIETIFAGRPYPGGASHGFLDVTELAGIVLPTQVHVSDVYRVILSVPGVLRVRRLQLRTCPEGGGAPIPLPANSWVLALPKHTLPVLSIPCGGFTFYQNGQPLSVDLSSYNQLLELNLSQSGKVKYPAGSPYLDAPIPTGTFRSDLGDYYSIQNDFPQVYGIGPGALPGVVTAERLAQARQFKGYLLFFDQLLADYLAQLSHIRDLFALGTSANAADNHTYFIGDLSSVADLDALLRFPGVAAGSGAGAAGGAAAGSGAGVGPAPGTVLAYPLALGDWMPLSGEASVCCAQLSALTSYSFVSASERDNAIEQLIIDVTYATPAPVVSTFMVTETGRYGYVIVFPGYAFVLMSQSDFPDAVSAAQQAALVLFLGQDAGNFSRLNTALAGSFGFTICQSSKSYLDYLQTILEDGEAYRQRRKMFLDHLLARFAEVFTDYALLYLGDRQSAVFEEGQINAIGRFLSHFPGLSANRGHAFDYFRPGWNDDNISGLERLFKAYAGIKDWSRHHLCNFEVARYDPMFVVILAAGGEEWFVSKGSFAAEDSGDALRSLLSALGHPGNYQSVQLPDGGAYALDVGFYNGSIARSVRRYASGEAARADATVIAGLFGQQLTKPDIRISRYEYHLELLDCDSRVVRYSKQAYGSEEDAWAKVTESLSKPQDEQVWDFAAGAAPIGALIRNKDEGKSHQLLDLRGFNISAKAPVRNQPSRFGFEVLDNQNSFWLHSLEHFAKEEEAWEACIRFLYGLGEKVSYGVRQEEETGLYRVLVSINGKAQAISDADYIYKTRAAAVEAGEAIMVRARSFLYEAAIRPVPDRWRFYHHLGKSAATLLTLGSEEEYEAVAAAEEAARRFAEGSRDWKAGTKKQTPRIAMGKDLAVGVGVGLAAGGGAGAGVGGPQAADLGSLVQLKQEIDALIDGDAEKMAKTIVPDAKTLAGTYVYRLVDKDHPKARCPRGVATEAEAIALRKSLWSSAKLGYPFLELCLGGDCVVQPPGKEDPCAPYYFRLVCHNDYFASRGIPDKDIVLFESVQGYDSAGDAETAFTAQYLSILSKGMDPANYGTGKWITLDARSAIHQHSSPEGLLPQVLVPQKTQQQLGISGKNPVTELSLACQAYPIRFCVPPTVVADPCVPPPAPDPCPCVDATEVATYQFVLFNISTGMVDWESIGCFDTPCDALEAFYFFLMLLAYPGDYFIRLDEWDCLYYVKIREVLAESTQTFLTPDDAWGVDGVEKFIGVTQGPCGFHLYQRPDNCSYSFWVGCPDCRLVHPCKYDTPEKRDAAKAALHQGYQMMKGRDWLKGFESQREVKEGARAGGVAGTIYDGDDQPLASIVTQGLLKNGDPVLDPILDMIDSVWIDSRYGSDKQGLILRDASGTVIARSAGSPVAAEWKKALRGFAVYFPLKRTMEEKGGVIGREYRWSVQLPGFPGLADDPPYYMPCGCGPETPPGNTTCYTAWKNELVYAGARKAWTEYLDAFGLLGDSGSYRGVFDCSCGSFGIEMGPSASVIAVDPQSYYLPDEACAAVERAKILINAEGLELVEHILLRPCPEEPGIPVCSDTSECSDAWNDIVSQGLLQSPPLVPFRPGADPYSFIATVVLPAWPVRFNKPENRLQLEMILQREAPAHVLLRILWLCPHELCRFEGMYKKWIFWLGQSACSGFDRAAFLNLLFDTAFPCCDDRYVCCPGSNVTPPAPCWAAESVPVLQGSREWLSEINRLYCWADMQCSDTKTWVEEIVMKKLAEGKTIAVVRAPEVRGVEVQGADVRGAEAQKIAEVREDKDRNRQINMRLNWYRRKVEDAAKGMKNEPLGEKATAFLADPDPSAHRLEKLAEELSAGLKKAKKPKRERLMVLVTSIAGYWLDKWSLKEGMQAAVDRLKKTLGKAGLSANDVEEAVRQWNPGELFK